MLAPSESRVFKTLAQSEELVTLHANVLNSGFWDDIDPEYGFVRSLKLIEHFQIANPLEWFGNRDTEILINFMNTLISNHKKDLSKEGWRLSFAAFLSFWIMFENRQTLDVSFLIDDLNWEKQLAELFVNTAKQFN